MRSEAICFGEDGEQSERERILTFLFFLVKITCPNIGMTTIKQEGKTMFREIRRSEKITEKSAKQYEIDCLYRQLFDCRIGSKDYYQIRSKIDELEDGIIENVFDPDELI